MNRSSSSSTPCAQRAKREMMSNLMRIVALFFSKTGAVLVGTLFIPLYNAKMGDEAFGGVAIILSIQAFALMVDFGAAVLVGRDIASAGNNPTQQYMIWRQAELSLSAVYLAIFVVTLIACLVIGTSSTVMLVVVGCIPLYLTTVLQNIGQTALLARQHFITASVIQALGVLSRAIATVAALNLFSNTLLTFVWTQVAMSALQWMVIRSYCGRLLQGSDPRHSQNAPTWPAIREFLHRGRPLLVVGLAGAAVMQMDKPLLSLFVPAREVAPYFLATSLAVLPISLLAGPIVQYFQPQVIGLFHASRDHDAHRVITRFTLMLVLAVALPSWILWQWAEPIVHLWLPHSDQASLVAKYTQTLVPAFAVGGLCYVPVVLLMAVQDFRYQALSTVLLTAATLALVAFAGAVHRVDWACGAYVFYFMAASVSVWFRALMLPSTKSLARFSAVKTMTPIALLSGLAALALTLRIQ